MTKLKTFLALSVFHCVGMLSLRSARALGRFIGWLAYTLKLDMVRITRKNLEICFGELSIEEREQLVRNSLQETAITATEICVLWKMRHPPLEHFHVTFDNAELMESLVAQNQGVILLCPHLGNWELLAYYLVTLGDVTNLYQPPRLGGLEELIIKSRNRSGCNLVPTTTKGVAAILRTLRGGGISGILPDQNPP